MKSLRCRELGIDCDVVTSGETDQAVVTAMFAHSVEHEFEVASTCLLCPFLTRRRQNNEYDDTL